MFDFNNVLKNEDNISQEIAGDLFINKNTNLMRKAFFEKYNVIIDIKLIKNSGFYRITNISNYSKSYYSDKRYIIPECYIDIIMQNTTIQNTYYIGENIVNTQYKDLIDSSKSINKRCDISIVYDDIFELAIIHDDYTYYEVFIKFRDDVSYKVISNYVSNSNFKEILYNIKNKNTLNYNNYYTTITGRNYKNSLEYLSLCLIKNGMVRFYKDPNISNKFYFIFNYATLNTNYSSEMLNYITQYFKDIVGLDECVDIGDYFISLQQEEFMEMTFKSKIVNHKVFMKISKDSSLIPKYITNMINYYRLSSKQSRELSVLEVMFIS
jgi:hypothetical protein